MNALNSYHIPRLCFTILFNNSLDEVICEVEPIGRESSAPALSVDRIAQPAVLEALELNPGLVGPVVKPARFDLLRYSATVTVDSASSHLGLGD